MNTIKVIKLEEICNTFDCFCIKKVEKLYCDRCESIFRQRKCQSCDRYTICPHCHQHVCQPVDCPICAEEDVECRYSYYSDKNSDDKILVASNFGNIKLVDHLLSCVRFSVDILNVLLDRTSIITNFDLVKKLISLGADVDIAIEQAAYHGYKQIVDYLIGLGANIDNALIGACKKNKQQLVKYLFSIAPFNVVTLNTAIERAVCSGSKKLVKNLIDNGADINVAINEANNLFDFYARTRMTNFLTSI